MRWNGWFKKVISFSCDALSLSLASETAAAAAADCLQFHFLSQSPSDRTVLDIARLLWGPFIKDVRVRTRRGRGGGSPKAGVDLVLHFITKCGKGEWGSKISITLQTFLMNCPSFGRSRIRIEARCHKNEDFHLSRGEKRDGIDGRWPDRSIDLSRARTCRECRPQRLSIYL